jgi:two-component system KDP operon response regulator KdpE
VGIRILVIEHDRETSVRLKDSLIQAGYEPLEASNAIEGMRLLYNSHPSVVLLDTEIPGLDGWEACRRIREASDIPIIIVSGRNGSNDILRGFELGADDYVSKPFDHKELLSRVRAISRRSKNDAAGEPAVLTCNDLRVDLRTYEVVANGRTVTLSPTEFRLLVYLMRNRNRVATYRELLYHVWGPAYIHEKDYVKLYVRYLRKKLEEHPDGHKYIVTHRGLGYRLAEELG